MLYQQKNIKLEDVMKINLTQNEQIIWVVDGLQIKVRRIPKKANRFITGVRKENGKYELYIGFCMRGSLKSYLRDIKSFSGLEELRETYPQLFELEGDMHGSLFNP